MRMSGPPLEPVVNIGPEIKKKILFQIIGLIINLNPAVWYFLSRIEDTH